jgi:DNA-binding transcriptional regulator YhcF (GntR family)
MGQILHGTAKTTHSIRAKIQASEESIRELAQLHNINPKTVPKMEKLGLC